LAVSNGVQNRLFEVMGGAYFEESRIRLTIHHIYGDGRPPQFLSHVPGISDLQYQLHIGVHTFTGLAPNKSHFLLLFLSRSSACDTDDSVFEHHPITGFSAFHERDGFVDLLEWKYLYLRLDVVTAGKFDHFVDR
jgi:hypothetical protein